VPGRIYLTRSKYIIFGTKQVGLALSPASLQHYIVQTYPELRNAKFGVYLLILVHLPNSRLLPRLPASPSHKWRLCPKWACYLWCL